jgi:hypothetical protein
MGMFDYINYTMPCPMCPNKIGGIQSKDSGCNLETIPYWHVKNFYSSCDKCGCWVDFNLKENCQPFIPIENYDLTIKPEGLFPPLDDKFK